MKRFNITWRGEVTVEADNEEEAREIFGNMDIDADDEYQDVTITEQSDGDAPSVSGSESPA
jgi:hypothetical protein